MFDGRWRGAVDRSTRPVGRALHRRGITADVLTATGLISATATAVLVASGHLHLAIISAVFFHASICFCTAVASPLDGVVAASASAATVTVVMRMVLAWKNA
jgi:hypothetical protein